DPVGQLSNLFEKTRDAMVAFELARHLETTGQNAEAAKWYSTAGERFRRADWKAKAQEAVTRLGGLPPVQSPASDASEPASSGAEAVPVPTPEPALPFVQNAEIFESLTGLDGEATPAADSAAFGTSATPASKTGRRRRGRRGGRNRRKTGEASDAAGAPSPSHSAGGSPTSTRSDRPSSASEEDSPVRVGRGAEAHSRRAVEPGTTDSGGIALRGRYGDPGLSSRLSLLEMQFRRLLTCAPVNLNEADLAPAGPGVFLLSDSDLTSYYYVETCQTLRIAIPNLLRGGSTRRGADSIKPQLAEHLGIPETRVGKYLADHCVVRWLQLDEGASHFAHFVMAVLRPVLNE